MSLDQTYRRAFDLHVAGKLPEAEKLYREVLRQSPRHVGAMSMLGMMALSVGQLQAGADLIEQAVKINPNVPGMWANLGEAKRLLKRPDEAIECFRRAIQQEPNAPEPHNNLGILYHEQNRLDDAIASFRRAVALQPQRGELHNNLAGALVDKGDFESAVVEYRLAIKSLPGHAQIHNNLGMSLERLYRLEEADVELRRAVELKPDYAEAWNNIAAIDSRLARYDAAADHVNRALSLDPNHSPSRWTKSLLDLLNGDYRSGFAGYEERWNVPALRRPRGFTQPMWDGAPLNQRSILIHHEQGFGDMLQYARFLPEVARRGGYVIVEIQSELVDLFKTVEGVEQVVPAGQTLPDFELFAPMFSLPRILGVTLENLPRDVPYFKTDPARVATMRDLLSSAGSKKKVGLAWWGKFAPDPARSIHTDLLGPIIEAVKDAGAQLVLMQLPMDDLPKPKTPMDGIDLAPHLKSFADTAAAMQQLDLFVTLDSGIAHLAGAMGRPTLIMIPYAPDWRWMRDREDSPWYPTMRLFRQSKPREWKPVIERVAGQIKGMLS